MKTVGADTFYYLALVNSADDRHAQAYTVGYAGRMVTTSWVLTELANTLAKPATRLAFLQGLAQMRSDPDITILPPEVPLCDEGLKLHAARPDKEWSLTDCISFVVMQREGITEALAGDDHFEQAGFVALLK